MGKTKFCALEQKNLESLVGGFSLSLSFLPSSLPWQIFTQKVNPNSSEHTLAGVASVLFCFFSLKVFSNL